MVNDWLISEKQIWKDMKGSIHGLIWGGILTFAGECDELSNKPEDS